MADAFTSHSRRRGFTLVELLVVVAVLAVMISMLLPALKRARSAARTASCMANLRALGTGFGAYALDNQMWIGNESSTWGTNTHVWYHWLDGRNFKNKVYVSGPPKLDYSQDVHIAYRCPEMDPPNMYASSAWVVSVYGMMTTKATDPAQKTYSGTDSAGNSMSLSMIHIPAIRQPGTYPLLFDSSAMYDYRWHEGADYWGPEGISYPGGGAWAYQGKGIWMAHNNRANGLFADGHVESCGPSELRNCSTYNRGTSYGGTSNKRGIAVWKDVNGKVVDMSGKPGW